MASFVNADPTEIALVPNATSALNSSIASVARACLGPGKRVLALEIAYGSVKKMLQNACDQTGAELDLVPIKYPLSEDDLITAVQVDSVLKVRPVCCEFGPFRCDDTS